MKNNIKPKYLLARLILIVLMVLVFDTNSSGQESVNQNFIKTRVPKVALTTLGNQDTTNLIMSIQYIDGLGRPVQNVGFRSSPAGTDIVQPVVYDSYGRIAVKYLPYAASSGSAAFRTDAITNLQGFYYPVNPIDQPAGVVRTDKPYAVTVFEPSPLNRVSEQGFMGAAWQPAASRTTTGRTVITNYASNSIGDFSDGLTTNNPGSRKVVLYKVTIGGPNYQRTLVRDASLYYTENQLVVTITKNENWITSDGCLNTKEVYTDKNGRLILERTYNKLTSSQLEMLSTYYVYDDFGNLCFVLPPKATPDAVSGIPSSIDDLCYQYCYDERQRLVLKRVPGKEWELLFYNTLDQVVCTQNGNQRNMSSSTASQEASFTKYDALGRVIVVGTMTVPNTINTTNITTTRTQILAAIAAVIPKWETSDNTNTIGYTNTSFPITGTTPLLINYYDGYTDIPSLPATFVAPSGTSDRTTGLLTATRTSILNNATYKLWAVHYYDEEGRETTTFREHFQGGANNYDAINHNNYDKITTSYNFNGLLTQVVRYHYLNGAQKLSITNQYTYDHVLRSIKTGELIQVIGGPPGTSVTLSELNYNAIGQVKRKRHHSEDGINYMGEISYTYNPRGWLKTLTPIGSSFAEELKYEDPDASGTTPQYNGTISQFNYSGSYSGNRTFKYTYDKLNRLTSAVTNQADLDETISYDNAGNIRSLIRTGPGAANLAYTYVANSNKLSSVTKNGSAFRSYTYDANGNASSDGNLGSNTQTIVYNVLNLPQVVKKGSTTYATYYYDATGQKLRSIQNLDQSGTSVSITKDYVDGIVYNGSTIEFIETEEGKAVPIGNKYTYTQELKDYLGNIRASFDKDPNALVMTARLIQEDEYYAFGLQRSRYDMSNGSLFLYNGKEKQITLNNQYDYGARFYDPLIARWNAIDPMADGYNDISPYNYALNNPINFIDPTGADAESTLGWIKDDNGNISWDPSINSLQEFKDSGKSGKYMGMEGYGIDSGSGQTIHYNRDGTQNQYTANLGEAVVVGARTGVGQPGALEGAIPVWGSTRSSIDHFQHGEWLQGTFQAGMAISDLFLVKSLATAGIKLGAGLIAKASVEAGGEIATKTSIWTSTKNLTSVENAFGHFEKHAAEFPEFYNAKQYVEGTKDFLNNSPIGTFVKKRANGDILKYHPGTNTFGAMNGAGVPKTMFKPNDGITYWLKQ